jgi:type VI secretion system protein ImpC
MHTFETSDGSTDVKIPSEVLIPDRKESELSALGMLGIVYIKNSPDAVFVGGQSVHKPAKYGGLKGLVATGNHALAARIPYTFAVCRIAHYLKCMVRDKIGATLEEEDLQQWMQDWINDYVLENPKGQGEKMKADKPLQKAVIKVKPIPGKPGYYETECVLRPHFQLEGMDVAIMLATEVGQAK